MYVCMFSLCLYRFTLDAPVSSHSRNSGVSSVGNYIAFGCVYGCLSLYVSALWFIGDLSRMYDTSSPATAGIDFSLPVTLKRISSIDNGWMHVPLSILMHLKLGDDLFPFELRKSGLLKLTSQCAECFQTWQMLAFNLIWPTSVGVYDSHYATIESVSIRSFNLTVLSSWEASIPHNYRGSTL